MSFYIPPVFENHESLHISSEHNLDYQLEANTRFKLEKIKHLSLYIDKIRPDFERIYRNCPNTESIRIAAFRNFDLTDIDFKLHLLPKLSSVNIDISNPSFKLPLFYNYPGLERLILFIEEDCNGLEDLIENLHLLENIKYLIPPKLENTRFLKKLPTLKNLEILDLSAYTTLPVSVPEMLDLLKDVPKLRKIENFYPKKKEKLTETLLGLDKYDEVELISTVFKDYTSLPLFFSQFKHVNLHSYRKTGYNRVNSFRDKYAAKEISDNHRELLFLCHIESWNRVRERTKNYLTDNRQSATPVGINGFDKLASVNKTTLKNKLKDVPFYLTDEDSPETIWILHAKTPWTTIEKVILNDKKFITEEQLLDYLNILEKPYLLEEDNLEMSKSIIQLFCSSDEASLKMAFQMIEGGGATISVQSMLAAICIEHTSMEIRKAAKLLYVKVGNPAFKPLLGKSSYKDTFLSQTVSKHEAISRIDFLVMLAQLRYLRRNRSNYKFYPMSLLWKRLEITKISENVILFSNIHTVELSQNKALDMEQVIEIMSHLPNLETLFLDGCYGTIPESISKLKNLKKLNISSNNMKDFSVLGELTNLEFLSMMNCKVKNWDFIRKLPHLKKLEVSKAEHSKIPDLTKNNTQ